MILDVQDIDKRFGDVVAVNRVSFSIPQGQIVGLLGPNGAGKTTVIRMIMDILKPDRGAIVMDSSLDGNRRKNLIGYLPEDRGLYLKEKVRPTLIYFAMLKGLSKKEARRNTDTLLERLSMSDVARQQIRKLSKGNQQKIQLISALVANPRLLILDEPFTGLDPVNVKRVSGVLRDLQRRGTTIVLSTHQMNQVEVFCQHIFLMNQGSLILDGPLEEVIATHSGRFVLLDSDQPLSSNDVFEVIERHEQRHKIKLIGSDGLAPLWRWLAFEERSVRSVRPYRMPLSEIFIAQVEAGNA